MIYIKQYGAKRTGTNFIRWVLEVNFLQITILSSVLGWKHAPHPESIDWSGKSWDSDPEKGARISKLATKGIKQAYANNEIRYAISVKNPYAFYISNLKERTRKSPKQFKKLLKDIKLSEQLIAEWNKLYRSWYALTENNNLAYIIRYESLMKNSCKEISMMASVFGLKPLDEYRLPTGSLPAMNDNNWRQKMVLDSKYKRYRTKTFDANYYTDERYMDYFDDNMLKYFRYIIDAEVAAKLQYKVL